MRPLETDRGVVQLSAARDGRRSEFEPPAGWKLLRRQEIDCRMPDGKEETLFHERWFHPESRSGIVAYSTFEAHMAACGYGCEHEAAEVYYVVEGCGIGTFDSGSRETGAIAPIQRSEHATLDDARQALRALMEDNEVLFRGGPFGNRQAATPQLPKAAMKACVLAKVRGLTADGVKVHQTEGGALPAFREQPEGITPEELERREEKAWKDSPNQTLK